MSFPNADRRCVMFSGDATPHSCFSGISWETREYFYGHPSEFIEPFLPPVRIDAHINEIEFLAEAVCAVTWGEDMANLVLFGIADNSRANLRITKGHAKRGPVLDSHGSSTDGC